MLLTRQNEPDVLVTVDRLLHHLDVLGGGYHEWGKEPRKNRLSGESNEKEFVWQNLIRRDDFALI
jgi:hypothetical protein